MVDISIVIVNYNVQFFLRQCLNSIFKSAGEKKLEVIVVDNASVDNSIAMLAEDFPQVNVIQNEKNFGFSAANNQAIRLIKGKYTLILNPDTLLSEDTLETCFEYLEQNPKVGGLGVKMLDGAGNFHKESKRGYPSLWASICKMTGIYKFFPNSKIFNGYYQGHISDDQIAETEVLCGAFMFMQSKIFKDLNGFDESFFMYGEDIDLSYRISKSGYSLIYFPKSSIIHYKGESRRRVDSRYIRSFYGSMHIFLRKHTTGFFQRLLLPFFAILIAFKAGVTYLSSILRNFISPIVDFGLICIAQLFLKDIWEKFYFNDIAYYEEKNVFVVIASFSAIYVLFQYLAGKYDLKYQMRNLFFGFISSVLIVFLIYAILPAGFRFSRLLVATGSLVSFIVFMISLSIRNYLKKGKFGLNVDSSKAAILIGSQKSANSFNILSEGNQLGSKLIGYVNNRDNNALGSIADLNVLLQEIPTDEIIFSAKDIGYKFMQEQMASLGSKYEYKILSEDSMSLLSSNFADKKGSIYTIQTGFKIDESVNRRLKRGVDILMGIALLTLSPLLLLLTKLKLAHIPALLMAIVGSQTLVSYNDNEIDLKNFPEIKNGVFKLKSNKSSAEQEELFCINFAKNHSLYLELEQIIKALF